MIGVSRRSDGCAPWRASTLLRCKTEGVNANPRRLSHVLSLGSLVAWMESAAGPAKNTTQRRLSSASKATLNRLGGMIRAGVLSPVRRHPVNSLVDAEIQIVRKVTSGTGDVNPTTAVSIARAEREVPLQRHLTRGRCGAYRVIGVAFSVLACATGAAA